jgi:hypothetical protein
MKKRKSSARPIDPIVAAAESGRFVPAAANHPHVNTAEAPQKARAPPDPDDLLPTEEAAAVLFQKASTLIAWRCAGKGPVYFKLGRRCLYRRVDLSAWVAAQRKEPTKAQAQITT